MSFRVVNAAALDALREIPDASVDALVTDPPAGIEFMGKEWDSFRGDARQPGDETFHRSGSGPHDRSTVRYGTSSGYKSADVRGRFIDTLRPIFAECLRVLKPGAHGVVWALPRTSHWTATALEDAGFEIRDVVTHLFGSGFPKSRDVSKGLDRAAGAARTVVGVERMKRMASPKGQPGSGYALQQEQILHEHTVATTADAKRWAGWGTALKPASEHWIVVRRPLAEKNVAANVLAHGTGALNIDGCRIGFASDADRETAKPGGIATSKEGGGASEPDAARGLDRIAFEPKGNATGRWPANVVLSHHPLCEKIGERDVQNGTAVRSTSGGNTFGGENPKPPMADAGYGTESVEVWDCIPGCAVATLDAQSGDLQSGMMRGGTPRNNRMGFNGATSPNSAAGDTYGDKGGASRFFYVAKPSTSEKQGALRTLSLFDASPETKPTKNVHPTVKPVELMRYLCRLVTPRGGTIIDPFAGSGTTGVAGLAEGFDVLLVEREPDYAAIATARCEHAAIEVGAAS